MSGGVFFAADLHISHRLVSEIRGFSVPQEHDDFLAHAWDKVVRPGDHVWVLGDISAGGSSSQTLALDWISQRSGQKHLISGNHDGCWSAHRDSHKWQPKYLEVFDSVQMAARRRISGQNILLSHFPLDGDRGVDRYPQWRLKDLGTPILHGHTHSQEKISRSSQGTLQIHVGLDAHRFAPVSLQEVANLLV